MVRGPHSTGAGFVGRGDEKFSLAKRLGNPWNLLMSEEYEKSMSFAHPQKVLIGHNRSATIGDKIEENAHPFMFDHVIGAHNGTLDTSCIKGLINHQLYGTDSQAIFATISAKGVDAALKEMSGAWALTWFDNRDSTFNMLRNDKRPLHYTYSHDRNTLIWASEAEMLEYVLLRRRKQMQKDGKGHNQIFSLPPNLLYSWTNPNVITAKIDPPLQRKLEGRKWAAYHSGPFHTGTAKKHGEYIVTPPLPPAYFSDVPFDKRPKSRKFRHPYRDKYGRIITKKEFEPLVDEGCAFCNANGQKFGEFVYFLGPYIGYHTPYMCEDCYNSEEQYKIAQYSI